MLRSLRPLLCKICCTLSYIKTVNNIKGYETPVKRSETCIVKSASAVILMESLLSHQMTWSELVEQLNCCIMPVIFYA